MSIAAIFTLHYRFEDSYSVPRPPFAADFSPAHIAVTNINPLFAQQPRDVTVELEQIVARESRDLRELRHG